LPCLRGSLCGLSKKQNRVAVPDTVRAAPVVQLQRIWIAVKKIKLPVYSTSGLEKGAAFIKDSAKKTRPSKIVKAAYFVCRFTFFLF